MSFGTWLIVGAVGALVVWWVGKRSQACGVTLGLALVVGLVALALMSMTFGISGTLRIR